MPENTDDRGVDLRYQGFLDERVLALGPSISIANLTSDETKLFSEALPRSLTLIYLVEGALNARSPKPLAQFESDYSSAAVVSLSEQELVQTEMTAGESVKAITINVQPDSVADPEIAAHIYRTTRHTRFDSMAINPRLHSLAQELLYADGEPSVRHLLSESFVYELIARALQFEDQEKRSLSPLDKAKMFRVIDAIHAEPESPHTLTSLAREAGVSVSTLKTKFPILAGASVGAYIRQVRLGLAYRLIVQKGMPISEAASSVGYSNPSNFSTAFKRQFGFAPSKLRK